MAITIEVDSPRAQPLPFPPLGNRDNLLRSRHDFTVMSERDTQIAFMRTEFRDPIPGQRVSVDLRSGECSVIEPLSEPANAALAEKLEERCGFRAPREAVRIAKGAHPSTWLYHMQRAVERGLARLVDGKFPDELPEKPRLRENIRPRSVQEELRDTMRMRNAIDLASMSEGQRQQVQQLVDDLKRSGG